MPIERRPESLEQQIPLRCPSCGAVLTCETCQDWRQDAIRHGIDPDRVVDTLARILAAELTGGPTSE